jgi:copper chaperone CopZ
MARIKIKGMSCQHCVASTTKALEEIPGVSNVHVDLDNAEATYKGEVDPQIIREAIIKIGFEPV